MESVGGTSKGRKSSPLTSRGEKGESGNHPLTFGRSPGARSQHGKEKKKGTEGEEGRVKQTRH